MATHRRKKYIYLAIVLYDKVMLSFFYESTRKITETQYLKIMNRSLTQATQKHLKRFKEGLQKSIKKNNQKGKRKGYKKTFLN